MPSEINNKKSSEIRLGLITVALKKPSLASILDYYSRQHAISRVVAVELLPRNSTGVTRRPESHVEILSVANYSHPFNKAKALNLALFHQDTDWVISCDADVIISDVTIADWVSRIKDSVAAAYYLNTVQESHSSVLRPGPGIISFPRTAAISINGYDSRFRGWGCEDLDFIDRLSRSGIEVAAAGSALHLEHTEEERIQNYLGLSRSEMREKNHRRLEQKRQIRSTFGTLANDIRWWARHYGAV